MSEWVPVEGGCVSSVLCISTTTIDVARVQDRARYGRAAARDDGTGSEATKNVCNLESVPAWDQSMCVGVG